MENCAPAIRVSNWTLATPTEDCAICGQPTIHADPELEYLAGDDFAPIVMRRTHTACVLEQARMFADWQAEIDHDLDGR